MTLEERVVESLTTILNEKYEETIEFVPKSVGGYNLTVNGEITRLMLPPGRLEALLEMHDMDEDSMISFLSDAYIFTLDRIINE